MVAHPPPCFVLLLAARPLLAAALEPIALALLASAPATWLPRSPQQHVPLREGVPWLPRPLLPHQLLAVALLVPGPPKQLRLLWHARAQRLVPRLPVRVMVAPFVLPLVALPCLPRRRALCVRHLVHTRPVRLVLALAPRPRPVGVAHGLLQGPRARSFLGAVAKRTWLRKPLVPAVPGLLLLVLFALALIAAPLLSSPRGRGSVAGRWSAVTN